MKTVTTTVSCPPVPHEKPRGKRLRTSVQAGDNPGMGPYDGPNCGTVPYRSTDGNWTTIEVCT